MSPASVIFNGVTSPSRFEPIGTVSTSSPSQVDLRSDPATGTQLGPAKVPANDPSREVFLWRHASSAPPSYLSLQLLWWKRTEDFLQRLMQHFKMMAPLNDRFYWQLKCQASLGYSFQEHSGWGFIAAFTAHHASVHVGRVYWLALIPHECSHTDFAGGRGQKCGFIPRLVPKVYAVTWSSNAPLLVV